MQKDDTTVCAYVTENDWFSGHVITIRVLDGYNIEIRKEGDSVVQIRNLTKVPKKKWFAKQDREREKKRDSSRMGSMETLFTF
jgi:hypothetical protein